VWPTRGRYGKIVQGIFLLAYCTLLGLAYRLCGVFSVLSHPSRFKGIGVYLSCGMGDIDYPFQVFYFIRPTAANLAAYEKWSGSELQNQTWLGDLVDEVFKVELVEGNTMIIPTGWIHAVVSFFSSFSCCSPDSANSIRQLTLLSLGETFCIHTML